MEKLQPLPLKEQVLLLLQAVSSRSISTFEFVDKGLGLAAKQLDESRARSNKPDIFKQTLDSVLEKESKQAFQYGYSGGKLADRVIHPLILGFSQIISLVHPSLANLSVISRAISRDKISNRIGSNSWRTFQEDIEAAAVPPEVKAILYGQKLLEAAYSKMRNPVSTLLQFTTDVMEGREEDFWRGKVTGKPDEPGTEVLKGFCKNAQTRLDKFAQDIFGNDAKTALEVAAGIQLIDTVMLSKKIGTSLGTVRIPILKALGQKNAEEAKKNLKDLISLYPKIAPQWLKDQLEVKPSNN